MSYQPTFTPKARPVDTVGVQTRIIEGPRPVGPVRPFAPNAPDLPAPPPKDNRTEQLVTALAGFNKSLGTFLSARQEKQNSEDGTEAELRAIRDNVSSWSEAVRNDPSLADRSPFFRQMYESRVARNRVQANALGMISDYASSPIANSTDPGEIQKWLADRMKPIIDTATNPAEREAMLDEVVRTSKQFMHTHTNNARANLVYKNQVAYGQAVDGVFNEAAVKGGTAAYKTNDPVSKGLKPHEAGILNAIAGGESAGKYNIRYDGKAGATFELNGQHPAVKVMTSKGPSDAAGRYQFLSSTWRRVMGNAPFTPENQDQAALKLARMDYRTRTGRDLDADVQNEGFSPRIQSALGDTWIALKGNQGRHAEGYRATAARYAAGGGGEASGDFAFARMVHREEAQGLAQGMTQAQIDESTVDRAISAAMRFRDPAYLKVPLQQRPNGMPGAGMVPGMRDKLDQAQKQLFALQVKEDEEKYKREERDKNRASERANDMLGEVMFQQLEKGEAITIPPKTLAEYQRVFGTKHASTLVSTVKTLSEYQGTEDRGAISQLELEANLGVLTATDVMNGMRDGTIKSADTTRRLLGTIKTNRESTVLNDRTIQDILQESGRVAGGIDDFGKVKSTTAQQRTVDALRMGLIQWEKDNPNRPRHEAIAWLTAEKDKVIKVYNPESDFNQPAPGAPKSEVTPQQQQPAAPAPGQPKTQPTSTPGLRNVEPAPNVNWRTTPLYESVDALRQSYESRDASFAKWRDLYGLKGPTEIREWVRTQRALIEARSKK